MRLFEVPPLPVDPPAPNPRYCDVLGVTFAWAPRWKDMSPAGQAAALDFIYFGAAWRAQDLPSTRAGERHAGHVAGRQAEAAELAEIQAVAVNLSRGMPAGTLADRYRAAGEHRRAARLDQIARERGFRV